MTTNNNNNNEKKFKINFTKMQGAGNDFIVFELNKVERVNGDTKPVTIQELSDITTKLSHRKLGVGCDQLIIINDSPIQSTNQNDERVDFEMTVINCDGNIENMCGNGVRCFSKYIIDNNIKSKTNNDHNDISKLQIIKTKSGIVKTYPKLNHQLNTNEMTMIKVNMGQPKICTNTIYLEPMNLTSNTEIEKYLYTIDIGLSYCKQLECVYIGVGVAQCIVFIDRNIKLGNLDPTYNDYDKFSTINIQEISDIIQSNKLNFTDIANVEFVIQSEQDKLNNHLISRVVERGSGETLACGTGACGVALASILQGYTTRSSSSSPSSSSSSSQPDNNSINNYDNEESGITVIMPGGKLIIQWDQISNDIYKTGPATTVFKSQIIV